MKTEPGVVAQRANIVAVAMRMAEDGLAAFLAGDETGAQAAAAQLVAFNELEAAKTKELILLRDEWAKLLGKPIGVVANWIRETYAPTVNRIEGDRIRMCVECGTWFAPANAGLDCWCSTPCGARFRSRNRKPKAPTPETSDERLQRESREHRKTCQACRAGMHCLEEAARWSKGVTSRPTKSISVDRKIPGLTPEDAVRIKGRVRTSRRRSAD